MLRGENSQTKNVLRTKIFLGCRKRLVQTRAEGLMMTPSPLFYVRRGQIVTLAARYALRAIYAQREFAEIGGLMSYGPEEIDAYRLWGVYTGRILKGEKPADLPVMR